MAASAHHNGYTPGPELSSSSRATVHFVEDTGAAAPKSQIPNPKTKILKTYHTDHPAGPRRAALLLAFESAVAAQKAAHAKAPGRWAAIRDHGLITAPKKIRGLTHAAPQAAYIVTDYHPRTLAKIIDARLALPLPALHALVSGIIEALAALDAAADRPHGALTAGNIFIGGGGPLRKSPILLTEPAPLAGITPAQARAADHRALGTLIATLIRRRPHTGWPIEDGPEWTTLGKHKRAWLDFCNYLLDPNPPPGAVAIDELCRRFAKLGGRGMRTRTKIAIPIAALLVLVSPFAALRFAPFEKIPESLQEFAIKLGNLPPDLEEIPPEFAQLCDIWYEWFGSLCAEIDNPKTAPLWNADPWLRENIIAHASPNARAPLDPRVLTGDSRNLESLRANPPETAKRGLVVRRIKQAHAALDKLAESFVRWPGAQTLPQTAGRLEKLGFTAAAEELRAPDLAVLPSINSGRLPPNITRRLRLFDSAAAAEKTWAAAAARLDTLAATGDPVLRALRPREIARVAQTPLAELPAKIAETAPALDARVNFVKTDWAAKIGTQRWLAESFVRDHTGPADDAALKRWDTDISQYYIVAPAEDPRLAPDLETTAAPAAANALATITNEETALGGGTPVSTPLAQENAALRADLAAFKTEQVLRKDIPAAREKNLALQNRFTAFAAKIAAAMDELRPVPAEWLARIRAANIGPSAVLNAEWARRRDALLADVTPDQLAANDANFRALRGRVRQAREFLAELDGPKIAGSVKPLELDKNVSAPIAAQIRTADAAQNETLLTELLSQSQWNADSTPAAAPDDFAKTAAIRARIENLNTWRQSAAVLGLDLTRLENLLTLGAGWSEALLPGNAELQLGPSVTIQQLASRITQAPATPAVTAAGQPALIAAEVRTLERIPTTAAADIPELTRLAASASAAPIKLSAARAAWHQLAVPEGQNAWPSTVAQLDQEAALEKTLRDTISARTPPAFPEERREKLLAEIASTAQLRWRRGYAHIDVAHTNDVIARMPQFGVKPEDLTGLDRFDYLLNQAKQNRWARLTETEARDQRNTFVAAARATIADNSALEKFLADTQAINLEPTGEQTTPADIGPGRVGWEGEFSDDLTTITYRWTDPGGKAHVQQYRLVEPDAGIPFFLSTTAVSTGEFISLIESRPEGREVIAAMPPWMADVSAGTDTDFRPGPQTWRVLAPRRTTAARINDSRMALNTRWPAFLDPRWPEPLYAPGITPPAPPAADSPMQNLPPAAARLFAEKVLGARLPTPEEWAGVVERYAARLAIPGAPGANFSDATWLAQRDYLVQNGSLLEHPWPDSGAYAPPDQPPPTVQTHVNAAPFAPRATDNTLWFASVNATGPAAQNPGDFAHLFGNVATFLCAPDAPANARYAVAGGSAISPATIDPVKTYPVPPDAEGFADVGLRPAFDASKSMIIRGQLMMLLRKQPFVRQQKP